MSLLLRWVRLRIVVTAVDKFRKLRSFCCVVSRCHSFLKYNLHFYSPSSTHRQYSLHMPPFMSRCCLQKRWTLGISIPSCSHHQYKPKLLRVASRCHTLVQWTLWIVILLSPRRRYTPKFMLPAYRCHSLQTTNWECCESTGCGLKNTGRSLLRKKGFEVDERVLAETIGSALKVCLHWLLPVLYRVTHMRALIYAQMGDRGTRGGDIYVL